jgi:hypothetical protein
MISAFVQALELHFHQDAIISPKHFLINPSTLLINCPFVKPHASRQYVFKAYLCKLSKTLRPFIS